MSRSETNGTNYSKSDNRNRLFQFTFYVFNSIFFGFLVCMLINAYYWEKLGYKTLEDNLNRSYQYQMQGISIRNEHAIIDYSIAERWVLAKVDFCKNEFQSAVGNSVQNFNQTYIAKNNKTKINQAIAKVMVFINQIKQVSTDTTDIIFAKCFSIIGSTPVFIFSCILGAADGLLSRYIRTSEGGRESAFLFHRISDHLFKMPMIILFLYLATPEFINPEIIVVVLSCLFFTFFYNTTSTLKKYL